MFAIVGFNFCGDINALSATPNNIEKNPQFGHLVEIKNGIFNELFFTNDIKQPIEMRWDYKTVLWAKFENTLGAGNVDWDLALLDTVKLKRRKKNDFRFMTVHEKSVKHPYDLDFTFFDNFNRHDVDYEYALVPALNNAEGKYVTESIYSELNFIYLVDKENVIKLEAETRYDNWQRVKLVGEYITDNKYPIIIENGNVDYVKGELKTLPLTLESCIYGLNGSIERVNRENVINIIKQKGCLVLKDYHGNMWLIRITSNIGISYWEESERKLAELSFSFSEVGDTENEKDMYEAGMIDLISLTR